MSDPMREPATSDGIKEDPWCPRARRGQSDRDTDADPPTLVCVVGKTTLGHQLRCLEDLHAMPTDHGDWMSFGNAGEQKPAAQGTVEAWGRSPENPVRGRYGVKKDLRGRLAGYVPQVTQHSGLPELEHNPRNNRMRAR